jgi:subtilisin family serine protease
MLSKGKVRLCVLAAAIVTGGVYASTALAGNYIVVYKQQSVSPNALGALENAGGTVVYSYGRIGVVIAQSSDPTFRENALKDKSVEEVAATDTFAVKLREDVETSGAGGPPTGALTNIPASNSDPLFGLQWDMRQIHTPEAHAITGGSPSVLVGDLDTGLDYHHPDLAPNIDFANSVSCQGGVPNQAPAAWDDRNGHGTHTAGTIAAAANGIGIVGVAPHVRIAGIKTSTDAGFFFPEAVVCAFMWAGTHGVDVTNNSYFADPWLFNCRNDPVQRAIWNAERRAIRFAMSNGVTVVASMGNESDDLAHPQVDLISPDWPPGSQQEREVTNACAVVPNEVPGVVGVGASGNREQVDDDPGANYLKSFYSSYGVGVTGVVAPGGDSRFSVFSSQNPNGRVLSTWPFERPCARRVESAGAAYCYLQGTSMAAPHAAGVAALIVSRFGSSNGRNGEMAPGKVQAFLEQTSDPQPCPLALPAGYLAVTRPSGDPQECQGGFGNNGWYGRGQVNAFSAVTRAAG